MLDDQPSIHVEQMGNETAKCSYCARKPSREVLLVEAPGGNVFICRRCAAMAVSAIDTQQPEARRDTIVGAFCLAAMIALGFALTVHFGFGEGHDKVLGCICAGLLLLMGVMPTYKIIFGGSSAN